MALKPEISLGVALATGAVVYGIYTNATPTVADIRTLPSQNRDVASAEKQATWTAAAVVGGISLIAKDPTVFILGGVMVVALAWSHRHANLVDQVTGRASSIGTLPVMSPVQEAKGQSASGATYGGSDEVVAQSLSYGQSTF